MDISTSTSIFKFVTIRNATGETTSQPEVEIAPTTKLVKSLVDIVESDKKQPEKIQLINQKLEVFVQSPSFFKTKSELMEAVSKLDLRPDTSPGSATETKRDCAVESNNLYEGLYDNIVVRTITKSTTNDIFRLLTESIKTLHQHLNGGRVSKEAIRKLKIVLPEGLVISFSPPPPTPAPTTPAIENERSVLFAQLRDLTKQKRQVQTTIADYESQITLAQQNFLRQQVEETTVPGTDSGAAARKPAQAMSAQVLETPKRANANPAIDQLVATARGLQESEKEISVKLREITHRAFQLLPQVRYAFIGGQWVNVTNFDETRPPRIEGDSILVYSQGCYLKFPFQVADLRIVEQQSVGYLPAEIAHINNTQQGELHEKITRRLKRVETFESLITEDETFRETDTTSTEKFSIEKAASEVQSEESSINVNASVSGTYGVVTAALDAGYSSSQSSQNANSAAQSYAKEVVQKVVDRVSNKVRKERNLRTLEEFEETVKHVIDNTKSTGPKSYVYRWLTKLSRATLKNYGKRLIFQIDVVHPAHYYLSRAITEQPTLNIPANPKELLDREGNRIFGIDKITRENYLAWADLYNAKLEQPPVETSIVSYVNSGKDGKNVVQETIDLPEGYFAKRAKFRFTLHMGGGTYDVLQVLIGLNGVDYRNNNLQVNNTIMFLLNDETKKLPITIYEFELGYTFNLEIECELDERVFNAWQIKCYQAIIEAYENLKAEAENKMTGFDPNVPQLNPARKNGLIKTELKKGALTKMFRCNPFWITDNYEVGNEYDPDCCKDSLNGEKIRFLETLFDWNNITYELYPYLYADKDNWGKLLDLADDDPHFEAFLQASYATVRIPVYRDSQKETAAVNFIMNNSIANYEVVPEGMKSLLDELDNSGPTKFTLGLNGEELPVATEVVDLGIFPVPTDLVILECGVENGVKPIGFPQADAEGTDVSIPKQYSPAIIADSCPIPEDVPEDVGPEL